MPDADKWNESQDPDFANWKRIRLAVEHENLLLNSRMTWLLSAQAFLLAAYVLVFTATARLDFTPGRVVEANFLLYALTALGIFASGYLSLGLKAAYDQHYELVEWWSRNRLNPDRHPPICGAEPRAFFLVYVPYYVFGLSFVLIWVALAFVPRAQHAESYRRFVEAIVQQYGVLALVVLALIVIAFFVGRVGRKT